MQLNLNDDERLDEPNADAIASALARLEPNMFAVLERADEQYIQTYLKDDGTYQLEYRDGSYDKHFEATDETLDANAVVAAFLAFHCGEANWNEQWEWERVEFDEDFEGDVVD